MKKNPEKFKQRAEEDRNWKLVEEELNKLTTNKCWSKAEDKLRPVEE